MKESFKPSPAPPAVSCLTEPVQRPVNGLADWHKVLLQPQSGHLTPRSKGQRSFSPGCKDPNILVRSNPRMSGSHGTSLEPDAHMDHWQERSLCEARRNVSGKEPWLFRDGKPDRWTCSWTATFAYQYLSGLSNFSQLRREIWCFLGFSWLFGAPRDRKETFHQQESGRHSRLVPFTHSSTVNRARRDSVTGEYARRKTNTAHLSDVSKICRKTSQDNLSSSKISPWIVRCES